MQADVVAGHAVLVGLLRDCLGLSLSFVVELEGCCSVVVGVEVVVEDLLDCWASLFHYYYCYYCHCHCHCHCYCC